MLHGVRCSLHRHVAVATECKRFSCDEVGPFGLLLLNLDGLFCGDLA
jgi:hypothetical protein